MGLRQAASLGALQTLVTMLAGFASIKITSVYLGPAGLGLLSQFQLVIGLALGVVVSGMSTGVIRLTAEFGADQGQRHSLIATLLRVMAVVGLPLAGLIFLVSPWIASGLLHAPELVTAVRIFALCYVFGLLAGFVVGLANGVKDYKTVTLINIGNALIGLLAIGVLSPLYGIAGALVGAAAVPLASALLALLLARRKPWLPARPWQGGFSYPLLGRVSAFIPMAATSAILMPLLHIVSRDMLAGHAGMDAVGLVQGVWRLSDIYLGVITATLAMYYLPRFAEIRHASELRFEINRALMIIVPFVVAVSAGIYLLRDTLIPLVFTAEFMPMRELFAWMMVGNVLKMISWIYAYIIVARGSPWVVIGTELLFAACFMPVAYVLVPTHGAQGLVIAYAAGYLVYLAAVYLLHRRIVARMPAQPG